MSIAVAMHVGYLPVVGRLGPKGFRGQDGDRRVLLYRRRDYDDSDVGPSRDGSHGMQEVPSVHHWHAQVDQDETRRLALLFEPSKRLGAVRGFVRHVPFEPQEVRERRATVGMIVDDEKLAHGERGPSGCPSKQYDRLFRCQPERALGRMCLPPTFDGSPR
jgi:hypothetical protein